MGYNIFSTFVSGTAALDQEPGAFQNGSHGGTVAMAHKDRVRMMCGNASGAAVTFEVTDIDASAVVLRVRVPQGRTFISPPMFGKYSLDVSGTSQSARCGYMTYQPFGSRTRPIP